MRQEFKLRKQSLFEITYDGRGRIPLKSGAKGYLTPVLYEQSKLGPDKWIVGLDVRLPDGKLTKHFKGNEFSISIENLVKYR